MAVQEQFDPYRKWLGIPPAEQPPSHYRLLGIAEFEDDADVISHAADRSMAHVRTFQTGARSDLSQRILNELAAARRTLLGPEKSSYDASLRKQRAAAAPPPPPGSPPLPGGAPPRPVAVAPSAVPLAVPQAGAALAEEASEPSFGSPSSAAAAAARRMVRKKSSPPIVPMLLAVAGVLLVIVIVVVSSRKEAEPVADNPPPTKIIVKKADKHPEQRPALRPDPRVGVKDRPDSSHNLPQKQRGMSFDEALSKADEQLRRGNPRRARLRLQDAQRAARDATQRDKVDHWFTLTGYLEGFAKALAEGADRLEPGTNFILQTGDNASVLTFRRLDTSDPETELVFESNRSEIKRKLCELPAEFALPIARPLLPADDAKSKLFIAAYHTLHASGDKTTAKQLWEEALQAGKVDKPFLDEFKGEWEIASAGEAKPEIKIVPPSEKPDRENPGKENPGEKEPRSKKKSERDPGDNSPPAGTTPAPEGDALLEAKRLFREVFREKLTKAKAAPDKATLAQELFETGRDTKDNPAQKFVLLNEALTLATETANAGTSMAIVDALADEFAVDRMSLKADALEKAVKAASSPEHGRELYTAASRVFYDAKKAGRYDVAASVARSAAQSARRAQDTAAQRGAEAEARKLEALKALYDKGLEAEKTLADQPDDAAANAASGRFLCFVRGQWAEGLAQLQKGDDAPLAELAKKDLAAPTEVAQQAALGDAWAAQAKAQKDGVKENVLVRARHWYQQALRSADGLTKAQIEKSLAEVEAAMKGESEKEK